METPVSRIADEKSIQELLSRRPNGKLLEHEGDSFQRLHGQALQNAEVSNGWYDTVNSGVGTVTWPR